jgi:hypothetical protein
MTDTTKIVINAGYGGFSISVAAKRRYAELKGWTLEEPVTSYSSMIDEYRNRVYRYDLDRTDPILIQVVEELGNRADGDFADLIIVELPKGTLYRIYEYDGFESIETADDIVWKIA